MIIVLIKLPSHLACLCIHDRQLCMIIALIKLNSSDSWGWRNYHGINQSFKSWNYHGINQTYPRHKLVAMTK